MLEQLLTFVTPGPLTERFGFQTRVFTSWISFGLILGLISSIALISSGTATPDGAVVFVLQSLIVYPITICFLGLIGLGIDSMRGDAEHPGWYWWLLPIVAYIVIGFWLFLVFITVFLAFAGVNVPSPPRRHQRRQQQFNPDQFRKELQKMKVEDLLKDFREQIEQLEQLERQGKLNPQQEKVIRKIKTFDRSKYDNRLPELFDKEDMKELIMLLRLLGVEVR